MNLTFSADSVSIDKAYGDIRVDAYNVSTSEVLDNFSINEVIQHFTVLAFCEEIDLDVLSYFSPEEILSQMDKDTVLEYFGIEE